MNAVPGGGTGRESGGGASAPLGVTSLIGLGMRARVSRRIRLLSKERHWARNSAGIQRSQLRQLLETAKGTHFGKQHDFERLAGLPSAEMLGGYRKAVPVADWYAYKDMIARMREGAEPDVLWPGLVRDFAQTSGTTAGDKYIPVSGQMLRSNYLASLDIFAHAARFGVSLIRLLGGKSLFLGGSTNLATSPQGVRTGDLSGIVTPLIKWPITEIYLPGKDVALMSHWPSKIEAMAKCSVDADVRCVSGMPSWGMVLFERVMQMARERGPKGGRDVRTLRDVWPNFSLLIHGGVKYAPFESRVRQIFSGSAEGADVPYRVELYPASEGFVAIQDRRGDPGLRLNTDQGNFFEFVPLEEIDNAQPRAFACDEVEKNQKYVVVMSTCAGLWRYVLGDVVEFDTIPTRLERVGSGLDEGSGPARLRIVGRHRHFINAYGENLIVEHIENAVSAAARASGLIVGEFTGAPVYAIGGSRPGLELAVEFENSGAVAGAGALSASGSSSGSAMNLFASTFDQSLKDQNADYTTKRTADLGMASPTITPLAIGTFHRWLESKGKLGGQHKCPRCSNEREILEQVVKFGLSR